MKLLKGEAGARSSQAEAKSRQADEHNRKPRALALSSFFLIKCKYCIDQKGARQACSTSWKPAELALFFFFYQM